jgi:CHAT domain-containing protein
MSEELFGEIEADAWQKPNWLIAGDGVLLNEIPFPALPSMPFSASKGTLASTHTLRFLPSELLLLTSQTTRPSGRFLGIADPIYNLADSRRVRNPTLLEAKHNDSSLALARLAGSDAEIRSAAKLSGFSETQLLVGSNASGAALRAALLENPEVLHFAVHVVSPQGRPEEAALALSLTTENIPELLTPEAIAAYRVPGSLVVLSGCSSQQGETLPSAGLIGLSRAWLLAGAAAVIVSAWPTPDDSGHFFSSFYRHFQPTTSKSGSLAKRAAVALQQAQLEMQGSSGYRGSPSFWAAYSVISKE